MNYLISVSDNQKSSNGASCLLRHNITLMILLTTGHRHKLEVNIFPPAHQITESVMIQAMDRLLSTKSRASWKRQCQSQHAHKHSQHHALVTIHLTGCYPALLQRLPGVQCEELNVVSELSLCSAFYTQCLQTYQFSLKNWWDQFVYVIW